MAMNSDELARLRELVATRERPYNLGIASNKNLYELTDPRNEEATLARWQPVLHRLNIPILGTRDVPSQQVRFSYDGIDWQLSRMGTQTYNVPESVYHRIRAAEAEGVPFAYWLWGEEQFVRPTFQPIPEPTLVRGTRKRDPIVIGVILTAPNRGIWCLLGQWLH